MSEDATGTISVHVTDSNGLALNGATVSFKIGSITNTSITDMDGQVEVAGLPVGDYAITVSLTGYASQTAHITISDAKTATAAIVLAVNVTINSVVALLLAQIDTIVKAAAPAAVNQIIAHLESEEKTSSSFFVTKIRDPIEVMLLTDIETTVVSELSAGLTAALQDILKKLESQK